MRKGSKRSSRKSPAVAPDAWANSSQVEKIVQDHNIHGPICSLCLRCVYSELRGASCGGTCIKMKQADVQDETQPKHLINSLQAQNRGCRCHPTPLWWLPSHPIVMIKRTIVLSNVEDVVDALGYKSCEEHMDINYNAVEVDRVPRRHIWKKFMMALEILHPTWIKFLSKYFIGISIFISGIRSAIACVYISVRETMPFASELGIFTSKTAITCLRVGEEEILISHPLHLRLLKSPMQVLPLHNSCPMSILAPSWRR